MDYAMFFAGMLAMALLGGLIAVLFIRPWIRPMRRGWEASHEVMAENSRLSAAQVKRQTAEEQDRVMQAARRVEASRNQLIQDQYQNDQADANKRIHTIEADVRVEEARTSLIEAQGENDRAEEARRRVAFRQDEAEEQIEEIEEAIGIEEARTRLIRARRENDRQTQPCKPKNWFVRHRYLTVIIIAILVFVIMILIRIVTN